MTRADAKFGLLAAKIAVFATLPRQISIDTMIFIELHSLQILLKTISKPRNT
jgi:hypothetical protein